jgi:Domain of unknown function (DUF4395)
MAFGFPTRVNEKAARVIAGGVLLVCIAALATSAYWLLAVLAVGFWLRLLFGPTRSPFGWVAARVIAPRLGAPKPVPGPPKRFAQGMGAVMTTAGAIGALALGWDVFGDVILVAMIVAAGLESIFAFCLGCEIFGVGIRLGLVPEEICVECGDIWARRSSHA